MPVDDISSRWATYASLLIDEHAEYSAKRWREKAMLIAQQPTPTFTDIVVPGWRFLPATGVSRDEKFKGLVNGIWYVESDIRALDEMAQPTKYFIRDIYTNLIGDVPKLYDLEYTVVLRLLGVLYCKAQTEHEKDVIARITRWLTDFSYLDEYGDDSLVVPFGSVILAEPDSEDVVLRDVTDLSLLNIKFSEGNLHYFRPVIRSFSELISQLLNFDEVYQHQMVESNH